MVKKDKQTVSQKFNDFDAISSDELCKLLRKDGANKPYVGALVKIFSEHSSAKPNEELRLNDDVDEHEDDPDYMLMLGKLKEHGNAYRAEYVEEDGSRAIIKYEEASSSDTECDQEQIDGPLNQMPLAEVQGILDSHLAPSREEIEKLTHRKKRSKSNNEREENAKLLSHSTYAHAPHTPAAKGDSGLDKNCGQQQYRRKLRSYNTKQIDEHVNKAKEMEKVTRTDPRSKSKSGKEENVVVMEPVSRTYSRKHKRNKFKSEYDEEKIQLDPEYHLWFQKLKPVNDHLICTAGGIEVVYEFKSGERDLMKEDDDVDDDESSDVEIIDIDTFRKMINRGTTRQSAFRDKFKSGKEENVVVKEPVSCSRKRKRNKFKSGKEENVVVKEPVSCTYSRKRKRIRFKSECDVEKIQLDRDYHLWHQKLKPVNDHLIYTAGGIEVVYEPKSGERDRMKEDDDDDNDDESSDVEIIDIDTFRKMINRGTTGQSAFRDKVIAALRKPFDLEEYERRRLDIEKQTLKERHIDLRGGREKFVGKQEPGKCYLDYHPALNKKLSQAEAKGDLPKKLNLLRGFFLWIEQPEEFSPWLDKECLAVRPGSG